LKIRHLLTGILVLGGSVAMACSTFTPWFLYINLVRLDGPKVEGLEWIRVYNILDYDGGGRVLVNAVRQGRRIPLAKWENGQECWYESAQERCAPNQPMAGVNLESYFPNWSEGSDRKDELKKLYLPLIVEVDGREIPMALRSRVVRNDRELQGERAGRTANLCVYLDEFP
jgi:hypothetical protein